MKHNRMLVRVVAIVLAVLLAGMVVAGALFAVMAEEVPVRDRCELTVTYMEEQQALHVGQRLLYYDRAGERLDRVVFWAAPNMLRRASALMYENDDLETVFPAGYAPGGIDLRRVTVNGEIVDYGFQGEDELFLRVACDIEPGASAVFEFDYYLLLPECGAFVGAGAEDVRLGAFYFIPAVYDREFVLKKPLPFTRWLYSDAADYTVNLDLPDAYTAASTGIADENAITADNAREFALTFGKRWRLTERHTASGVNVRVFSGRRDAGKIADMAIRAIEHCEDWFGPFPVGELDVAQSDSTGTLNYPGLILVPGALMDDKTTLEKALRFCVAQQVFGLSAYVEPSADAWLSDSVCEYIAYLMLEADAGRDAFLKAVNRDWVSALQMTVPGGLRVTSDASLFNAKHYDIVVKRRGAVVLHELREAMGLESLLTGLAEFARMGADGHTLTELEFAHAFDAVTGGNWADFLTDWVFNVGDYVAQQIEFYN